VSLYIIYFTTSSGFLFIHHKHSILQYPNDLDNSFVDELCHFAKFVDIFKYDEPGNISTKLFLYKLIIDKGVQDIFPNAAIVLRMY